jgi:hypothetical protein
LWTIVRTVRLTHGLPRRPTTPSAFRARATAPNVAPFSTIAKIRSIVAPVAGSITRRLTTWP